MNELCLWLDSDVAWSPRKVRDLAERARKKGVRVVVHAHVHLETCRERRAVCRQQQLRGGEDEKPRPFSLDLIDSYLRQLNIEVFDAMLDRAAAERWSEILDRRYPTDESWKRAKLDAVRARLPDGASLRPSKVPMTTDWLVALAVEEHDAYVAVEDKGEEWSALRAMAPKRAFTVKEALEWLDSLADVPPAPGVG